MEILLVTVALLIGFAVPCTVAVAPPVVMAVRHRWPPSAVALWVLALGLLAGWVVTGIVAADRADATGGTGSWLAGLGWLLAAAAAAAASVVRARRQDRRPVPPGG